MNKYQEFTKAMEELNDPKLKHHCLLLISSARIYIGTYEEYSYLRQEVWKVIEQFFSYDKETGIAKQKTSQIWNINDRFVMYLYFNQKKEGIEEGDYSKEDFIRDHCLADWEMLKEAGLLPVRYYTFETFLNTIFSSDKLLESDLKFEYSLPDIDLEKADSKDVEMNRLEDEKVKLIRQCFVHWQDFKKDQKDKTFNESQLINFDKLNKAIEIYMKLDINKIDLSKYSAEDCFNRTFSEEYILELIQIMKEQAAVLPMFLTPTIDEITGKREMVIGKFGGYEEKLRTWTIPKYKESYNRPLEQFKTVMDELVNVYRTFYKIR